MITPELVYTTMQEREREIVQLWRLTQPQEQTKFPRSGLFLERIERFSLSSCMASVFRSASAS